MSVDAAVLLVAGIGSRLRPLTDDRPKALMDLGGETILSRALRLLIAAKVPEIVLATGYRDDQIRRAVATCSVPTTLIRNPEYDTTQNSVSLALCSRVLKGKSFLKLDGDVVFQPLVLERLFASRVALAVAVDSRRALDAEAMKVKVADGHITEFGKQLSIEAAFAETIGIERLTREAGDSLFSAMDRAIVGRGERDKYYEHFYSELVRAGRVEAQVVEVGDLAWSEVDTPEDLARARAAASRSESGA
jgi:choline kinase